MVCGVETFQTENGFELNRGCLTRKEHNEYAVECAASTKGTRVEAMNDTTNCSPNELPVTGGNSRQIFVWKVLVIINKGNNIAKRSNVFFLLTMNLVTFLLGTKA